MDAWARVQSRVVGRGRPSNTAEWNREAWHSLEESEAEATRLREAVARISEETAKIERLGQQATQLSAKHADILRALKSGLRKSESSGWDAQFPAAASALDERLKLDAQERLISSVYGKSSADGEADGSDADGEQRRVVNAFHADGAPVRALQDISAAANRLEVADRHRWVREWPVRLWVAWGTLCLHAVVITLLVLPCLLRFAAGRVPWAIIEAVHWRLYGKPPSQLLEAAAAEYAAAAARVGSVVGAGNGGGFRSSFNQFGPSGRFGSGSVIGGGSLASVSGGMRVTGSGMQASSSSSSSAPMSMAAMMGFADATSSSIAAAFRGIGGVGGGGAAALLSAGDGSRAFAPAATALPARKGVAHALASFWSGGAAASASAAGTSSVTVAAAPASSAAAAGGGAAGDAPAAAGTAAGRRAPPAPPPLPSGAAGRAARAAPQQPAPAAGGAARRKATRAARSLSPPRR